MSFYTVLCDGHETHVCHGALCIQIEIKSAHRQMAWFGKQLQCSYNFDAFSSHRTKPAITFTLTMWPAFEKRSNVNAVEMCTSPENISQMIFACKMSIAVPMVLEKVLLLMAF